MNDRPLDEVPPDRHVNVTGSYAIQIGDYNVQYNLFVVKPPPGPVVAGSVPQAPRAVQPREALMTQLRGIGPGVSVVTAVTGMRGVGKTQLAAAYARECREAGWRLIAWVDAEDTVGILGGLNVIADRLGIEKSGKTLNTIGQEVRNRLEADGERCLIVFDNVANYDLVRPYLPALGACRVLLTTVEVIAAGVRRPIQVGVFSEEEALAFLAERTEVDEPEGARLLAQELGFLPLALSQAAAVIASQHLTYSGYLARLRMSQAQKYLLPVRGDPYPLGVADTILLSIDAVAQDDPTGLAIDLLSVISLLSAEGVSRPVLYCGQAADAWTGDEDAVNDAIARLAASSLLAYTGDDSVIAHRLIMRVLRERAIYNGELLELAVKTADLLKVFTDSIGEIWAHRSMAREAVRLVTALADHLGSASNQIELDTMLDLRIWAFESAATLYESPEFVVDLGERLVPDFQRRFGNSSPRTLEVQNDLAYAYQASGRLGEAVDLYRAVLADSERFLGPLHIGTLTVRNNLALAYRDIGRLDEAISLYEAVLDDRERVLGSSHLDTLTSRSNLGLAYREAGLLDRAIPLLEAVLADRERILGALHPGTLSAQNNLALAYSGTGRLGDAVLLLEQVLAACVQVLGDSHPHTLKTRNNLGRIFCELGRADEAVLMHQQAHAGLLRVLGQWHLDTLLSEYYLACAYRETGKSVEALASLEQALTGLESILGSTHPTVSEVRTALSKVHEEESEHGG